MVQPQYLLHRQTDLSFFWPWTSVSRRLNQLCPGTMSLPRPLLSAEHVDSQPETQQTTVSLVKMSKREFIYNVTASVSSELKDKHIHIYTTHISKKTSYHQPIKSLVTIYIYWQENLATVNSRPKLGRITLLTVCEIFLCRAWNLQFSPSVFNNNNMIFIRRTDKPL